MPTQAFGQKSYFAMLQATLSTDRLDPYRIRSDADHLDGAARYLWNMALCEAIYPVLQALEVAFRNTLHDEISKLHGATWYDVPGVIDVPAQRSVIAVKTDIIKNHKPVIPGRVVASLTFGFWTSLLNLSYERPLWQKLLRNRTPFPHAGHHRTRKHLAARMNHIRYVRNRVFHHEPIWARPTLVQDHAEILEAIGWIDPVFEQTVRLIDRFPLVYQQGVAHYRPRLDAFCQQHGYNP